MAQQLYDLVGDVLPYLGVPIVSPGGNYGKAYKRLLDNLSSQLFRIPEEQEEALEFRLINYDHPQWKWSNVMFTWNGDGPIKEADGERVSLCF